MSKKPPFEQNQPDKPNCTKQLKKIKALEEQILHFKKINTAFKKENDKLHTKVAKYEVKIVSLENEVKAFRKILVAAKLIPDESQMSEEELDAKLKRLLVEYEKHKTSL
jgi:hypothetical protein